MSNNRRLSIAMVPRPLWGQSLNQLLPRSQWDKLRLAAYEAMHRHCAICNLACLGKGSLLAHEVWEYDDQTHVARLAGIQAICIRCSMVIHWGRTMVLVREGQLRLTALDEIPQHFCVVNGCDRAAWDAHKTAAIATWQEQSR